MSGQIENIGGCNACGTHPNSGNCYTDEWDMNSAGHSKCGALDAGCQYKCKHVKYLGNYDKCCIGVGTTQPNFHHCCTCDPKIFNNTSISECSKPWGKFCSQSDNLIKNKFWKEWCNNFPGECKPLFEKIYENHCNGFNIFSDNYCKEQCPNVKEYCNEMKGKYCSNISTMKRKECLDFCNKKENKKYCDDFITKTCATNIFKNDPYCSCFRKLSSLDDPVYKKLGKSYDAYTICFDGNCVDNGYYTANQLQKLDTGFCPQCIQTQIYNALDEGKINARNISQSCKVDMKNKLNKLSGSGINTTPPLPNPPPLPKPPPKQNNKKIILGTVTLFTSVGSCGFFFIFIICLCIITIFLFYGNNIDV